ncbi:DUF2514 domain-containing protein [Aeromonas sp. A3]|uniref:DUF2514 domain-containing protein n=2 Tax=unclassified Aeromonas TaxID=257493 RepID=UPI00376FCB7D
MAIEVMRRAMPYLMVVAIAACVMWGAYRHGVDVTTTEWQGKWDKQAAMLAESKAKDVAMARKEEHRRQAEIDEVRDHAQEQIAQAQADAAAAGVESGRLREQARRLAARASQCASNSGATQGSPAAEQPAVVLADLLSRADERAGELAAAYDRARASGLACERAYDSLRTETMKPRP